MDKLLEPSPLESGREDVQVCYDLIKVVHTLNIGPGPTGREWTDSAKPLLARGDDGRLILSLAASTMTGALSRNLAPSPFRGRDCPKRLPVSRVGHPLAKPDEGAVVHGQARGSCQLADSEGA